MHRGSRAWPQPWPALLLVLSLRAAAGPFQAGAEGISGHHYSYLEGAAIGHDFGRNPWSAGGRQTEGFASVAGRATLRRALERAVEAGETAMSFDFGFDLRSIVQAQADGSLGLDPFVLPAIDAFLAEVEAAHAQAQERGQTFSADVVLMDFRLADGQRVDERVGGEFPQFITSADERRSLLKALAPALARLGGHPLLILNLMNEPEFVALPAAKALARLRSGQWAEASLVYEEAAGKMAVVTGEAVVPLLKALDSGHVRVHPDRGIGSYKLAATSVRQEEVDAFLLDLRAAVAVAAPGARTTIGWADDHSALESTLRLEERAGGPLSEVLSFHVYQVPVNPWHPLALRRSDFAAQGLGDRPIRITEWGLGRLESGAQVQAAMVEAFIRVQAAGLGGVLFWWDDDHAFDHRAYRAAVDILAARQPTLVTEKGEGPAVFALYPAFPNPFNHRVAIPYELRQSAFATLRLYSATGQRVRQLVQDWQEAGAHQVVWDGRDGQGRPAASGAYLYELRAGDFAAQGRVMLLR